MNKTLFRLRFGGEDLAFIEAPVGKPWLSLIKGGNGA
jgi:hypothetical protein